MLYTEHSSLFHHGDPVVWFIELKLSDEIEKRYDMIKLFQGEVFT